MKLIFTWLIAHNDEIFLHIFDAIDKDHEIRQDYHLHLTQGIKNSGQIFDSVEGLRNPILEMIANGVRSDECVFKVIEFVFENVDFHERSQIILHQLIKDICSRGRATLLQMLIVEFKLDAKSFNDWSKSCE